MKLKYEFSIREIAGDYVLVPLGEAALKLSGMITTNEVGAFLWEQLQDEISKEELLKRLLDEFETESNVALNDIEEFLEQMRRLDVLEEFSE